MSIARQRKIKTPPRVSLPARLAFRLYRRALGRWLLKGRWSNVGIMGTGLTGLIPTLGTVPGKRLGETLPRRLPQTCITEMDAIRDGLGDTCPDC
ncbi:hypothetical protein [Nitrobacter vulgaris]|uniref:Uncharacterized protein n=1 Tax=Nitrobacter vulgaris TaxID=29421 RepID=A0A1V4HWX7_NITVU|nr:hypothetical protein [Nitrobacter vulgaris]OPH82355.1 hypothetical protein B2M20_12770 [Nitrobacter vulgaris]